MEIIIYFLYEDLFEMINYVAGEAEQVKRGTVESNCIRFEPHQELFNFTLIFK